MLKHISSSYPSQVVSQSVRSLSSRTLTDFHCTGASRPSQSVHGHGPQNVIYFPKAMRVYSLSPKQHISYTLYILHCTLSDEAFCNLKVVFEHLLIHDGKDCWKSPPGRQVISLIFWHKKSIQWKHFCRNLRQHDQGHASSALSDHLVVWFQTLKKASLFLCCSKVRLRHGLTKCFGLFDSTLYCEQLSYDDQNLCFV